MIRDAAGREWTAEELRVWIKSLQAANPVSIPASIVAALLARVEALAKAVEAIRYETVPLAKGGGRFCRGCGRWLDEGCAPDCLVAQALGAPAPGEGGTG